MVDEALNEKTKQVIRGVGRVPESLDQYFENKLPLHSNLKKHFDTIPLIKPILSAYMSSQCQDELTKKDFKRELIAAGVYDDEDTLEFLLLLGENHRSFNDIPQNPSDEDLGRYFFEKYKAPNEQWNTKTFRFSLENNNSYQPDWDRVIEEVAIGLIAHSRGSLAKVITEPPVEITRLISTVDDYFQEAFNCTFGKLALVSLTDVTCVTRDYTTHTDRISGKALIYVGNFYQSRNKFVHYVMHEGTHLCFNGFNETSIEEGFVEYLIEKMFQDTPPKHFSYCPVSETYTLWKQELKSVFGALPESESRFTQYFLTHDFFPLKEYLKGNWVTITEIAKDQVRTINGVWDGLSSLAIGDQTH